MRIWQGVALVMWSMVHRINVSVRWAPVALDSPTTHRRVLLRRAVGTRWVSVHHTVLVISRCRDRNFGCIWYRWWAELVGGTVKVEIIGNWWIYSTLCPSLILKFHCSGICKIRELAQAIWNLRLSVSTVSAPSARRPNFKSKLVLYTFLIQITQNFGIFQFFKMSFSSFAILELDFFHFTDQNQPNLFEYIQQQTMKMPNVDIILR